MWGIGLLSIISICFAVTHCAAQVEMTEGPVGTVGSQPISQTIQDEFPIEKDILFFLSLRFQKEDPRNTRSHFLNPPQTPFFPAKALLLERDQECQRCENRVVRMIACDPVSLSSLDSNTFESTAQWIDAILMSHFREDICPQGRYRDFLVGGDSQITLEEIPIQIGAFYILSLLPGSHAFTQTDEFQSFASAEDFHLNLTDFTKLSEVRTFYTEQLPQIVEGGWYPVGGGHSGFTVENPGEGPRIVP